MFKLEELYQIKEALQSKNALTEDFERKITELEEDSIQNEIIPAIAEKLEPVLKQIKRNMVLIVDYSPKEGVNVQVSERRNSSDKKLTIVQTPTPAMHEVVKLNKPEKAYAIKNSSRGTERKSKTVLRVTFPDGTVSCESVANDTVIKCIKKIGIQAVADLCYTHPETTLRRNGVNLVTKQRSEKYSDRQTSIGNGWLVFNCTSTKDKKKQLMAISDSMGLKLKVEIV